jgi:hypothetical protein
VGVLNEYKAAHPAAPQALAHKMDGALLAIGTLSDVLKVRLLAALGGLYLWGAKGEVLRAGVCGMGGQGCGALLTIGTLSDVLKVGLLG